MSIYFQKLIAICFFACLLALLLHAVTGCAVDQATIDSLPPCPVNGTDVRYPQGSCSKPELIRYTPGFNRVALHVIEHADGSLEIVQR